MKKISLFALFVALTMTVNAVDLWTESKHVSWGDGGIQIAATEFAEAQPGNKLVVHFSGASDGIEFKVLSDFHHLPGSREAAWINGDGTFDQYLTAAAVEDLKAYGVEIIGANFDCTKVELVDGKALKEGISVWTGFFWADEWSTLELYSEGYSNIDFSKIEAVRFYSEANRTDYVINFLKGWNEGEKFADQNGMTMTNEYAELTLTDELRTSMTDAGHWMIQFNKESGEPFNVTDVVLVPKNTSSLISNTTIENKAVKRVVNGQVMIVRDSKTYNILGAEL